MSKSQKQSVVDEVMLALPNFVKYSDNAILLLSSQQLENIKANVFSGIINGTIEYSKDINNHAEVRSYARSMVMNHLKKAKELNGGNTYTSSSTGGANHVNSKSSTLSTSKVSRQRLAPKGVNPDLLTEELKEYAQTLV
jgi:hypothetical protein